MSHLTATYNKIYLEIFFFFFHFRQTKSFTKGFLMLFDLLFPVETTEGSSALSLIVVFVHCLISVSDLGLITCALGRFSPVI